MAEQTTRVPLIAGNWKMNLDHLEAVTLVQRLTWLLTDADHDQEAVEVAVFPPFTDLRSVQTLVTGDRLDLAYGAQDLSPEDAGAYTGDVSGAFLAALGCRYAIVGHSERRTLHGEDDALVARKAAAALRGPAALLFLALVRRVPLDRLEVFGDQRAADDFLAATPF